MKASKLLIIPGALVALTAVSGFLLSSVITRADSTSNASVTVEMACTMSVSAGTGGTATSDGYSYSATIDPGRSTEIPGSIMTTSCNGPGDYSLYAIGFSGDSYDTPTNNQLLGSGVIAGTNIATGTSTSGNTSNWAFKLINSGSYSPTIISPYNNYASIPGDSFAKVATYIPGTTGSATASSVQAKYQVYIASAQTAGTYTGKVKYTMVYPNDASAPVVPPSPPTSCNTPVPNYTYMQEINSTNISAVLTSLEEGDAYFLRDNRDEEPYCVSKLADGNLWMLDNLRLDITNSNIMNGLTTANTNADANSLTSLRSGNRSAGDQYAISGFEIWNSSNPSRAYNQAKANADSKDTLPSNTYGNGSGKIGVFYNYCAASAGSYCYDSGAGVGNASYDLCPAGWRMPTSGSSGEYEALYAAYSSNPTNFKNALSTPIVGHFDNGSAIRGRSSTFWSSTFRYSGNMYTLAVYGSVEPNANGFVTYGYSLRCIRSSS